LSFSFPRRLGTGPRRERTAEKGGVKKASRRGDRYERKGEGKGVLPSCEGKTITVPRDDENRNKRCLTKREERGSSQGKGGGECVPPSLL